MIQIPSQEWPRRTNPLIGTEDLLKQNPINDAFPQEERIPVNLVSNYIIGQITVTNVGSGIGVYDFKNAGNIQLRSFNNGSNKVSIGVVNKTLIIDVIPVNIAHQINLTDLSNVSSPSTSNQYLKWDGSSFVFDTINPYALVVKDYLSQSVNLNSGDNLTLFGAGAIGVLRNNSVANRFDFFFNGGLNHLSDVTISGSVPNGYILSYNSGSGQWGPSAPSTPPSYSFNIKADDVSTSNVIDSATVSILGNSNTITTAITGSNEITVDWTANLSDLENVSTILPSNNQVLTYNTTNSQWEPQNTQSVNVIGLNGLTSNSNLIKLGGTLSSITTINGSGSTYPLYFVNLQRFQTSTSLTGHTTTLDSNLSLGVTQIKNTKTSNSNNHKLVLDSVSGYASIETQNGTSTKKYILKNTTTEAGLYYEFTGSTIAGFIAQENKIIIKDGINTPSAGHVLTFMANGSAQFQPISSGSGDDWGAQVVEHDSTLTGDGVIGSLLAVTNPLPLGYANGNYLGVSEGVPTWLPFPNREFVGICEVERDSEVSVFTGKSFFTVPPQMNGWKIFSYIVSVYTLGSGGTTNVELARNGVTIGASTLSLSAQFGTKSSINQTVSTGDRISLNVTGAKSSKDKGLSLTFYLTI